MYPPTLGRPHDPEELGAPFPPVEFVAQAKYEGYGQHAPSAFLVGRGELVVRTYAVREEFLYDCVVPIAAAAPKRMDFSPGDESQHAADLFFVRGELGVPLCDVSECGLAVVIRHVLGVPPPEALVLLNAVQKADGDSRPRFSLQAELYFHSMVLSLVPPPLRGLEVLGRCFDVDVGVVGFEPPAVYDL